MLKRVAGRDAIRAFDRWAIETLGVPGIALMENAGRQIAEAARGMLGGKRDAKVVILAGRGNNGGDGFVVARHLAMDGVRARTVLVGPREGVRGDAATNLRVLEAMGLGPEVVDGEAADVAARVAEAVDGADLVVDGLLGTGTKGEVREPYAGIIEAVNASGAPVLAIDIPSGLDPDTGRPLGPTIRAARTVTMAAVKKGFSTPGARAYTGEVVTADIGVPTDWDEGGEAAG